MKTVINQVWILSAVVILASASVWADGTGETTSTTAGGKKPCTQAATGNEAPNKGDSSATTDQTVPAAGAAKDHHPAPAGH